jgi:hypothetical protein
MEINQFNSVGQKHGYWEEKVSTDPDYPPQFFNFWRGNYVNGIIEGLWVRTVSFDKSEYDSEYTRVNFVNDNEEGEKIDFR